MKNLIFNLLNFLQLTTLATAADDNTLLVIILTTVGVGLLLIVLAVVLVIIMIPRKCQKLFRTRERKYEYLHSLLVSQDAQYIQRLEMISRTNLLYGDTYSQFLRRFKEIRDTIDVKCGEDLNDLSTLLFDKKYKEFKAHLKATEATFNQYDTTINTLNNDLIHVIKPEEDCRQSSLLLKDKFRDVKSKYNSSEGSLAPLANVFEGLFLVVDKKFNEFEGYVETAQYDSANALLPDLSKVLQEILGIIEEMPALLVEIDDHIPQEVNYLHEKYVALEKEGITLKHLNIPDKIKEINESLQTLRVNFQALKIGNSQEVIGGIHQLINTLNIASDKEVHAHEEFNEKYENTIRFFNDTERNIINVANILPKYKKVYIIDDQHEEQLALIRESLEEASKAKRRLDIFVHSINKTPFTVLIEQTNELDEATLKIKNEFENFKFYLGSLKIDSEGAFKAINARYLQLKQTEAILRDFNSEKISALYKDDINSCYNLMDQINATLKTIPLDVIVLNNLVNSLNDLATKVISEVDDLNNFKSLAHDNILFINRDRMKFADVNSLVSQAESLYFDGDYKKSYDMTSEILIKLNDKDKLN